MKKQVMITGLLLAGILCSCNKSGDPEDEEQVQKLYQTTNSASEEDDSSVEIGQSIVSDYLNFSESELFFGKEGGEKTITCPEKWGFDLQSERVKRLLEERIMGIIISNEFDDEELKSIRQIEMAEFTRAASKLIVPQGCWTEEVVGERPNLSFRAGTMEKVPSFDYIKLYEYTLRTCVQGEDEGFPPYAFATFIDMGWFTATRKITDWYEYYEGFAYLDKTFDNGVTAPYVGVTGTWWIPKEPNQPGNYAVTITVKPNTTGEPRQFTLFTSAEDSPIIIYQE